MAGTARLLPEWAAQEAVLLAWPHPDSDWGPHLGRVEPVYRALVRAISAHQDCLILCREADHRDAILEQITGTPPGRVHLVEIGYDDTWVRDYGPLAVGAGEVERLTKFRFTGWGGKYAASRDDAVVPTLTNRGLFAREVRSFGQALEGGALETDGAGTLLTTRQCLLNPNRGALGQAEIEAVLAEALGIDRVLWLDHGRLAGDDTDAHIDTLARFIDPRTIAYVRAEGIDHPDAAALYAMETELEALRDRDGRPYRLLPLPLPRPQTGPEGRPLPATPANLLFINGAVLVPTYEDPADAVVLQRLGEVTGDRELVPIDARGLILQYGSIHCATLQLPRGSLNPAVLAGVE